MEMKLKYVSIMFALLLMMVAVATVGAAGHTSSQLEGAGWNCFNAGPNGWLHCMKKNPADGPSTIPVKVFSADGSDFLSTELLIRDDLYNGQPCPQEGGGEYGYVPDIPYRACHHS
jgi:hypothetical protein